MSTRIYLTYSAIVALLSIIMLAGFAANLFWFVCFVIHLMSFFHARFLLKNKLDLIENTNLIFTPLMLTAGLIIIGNSFIRGEEDLFAVILSVVGILLWFGRKMFLPNTK